MTENLNCHSCGMPIESGPYCDHCTDDTGTLQSFDERVSPMSQFIEKTKSRNWRCLGQKKMSCVHGEHARVEGAPRRPKTTRVINSFH